MDSIALKIILSTCTIIKSLVRFFIKIVSIFAHSKYF